MPTTQTTPETDREFALFDQQARKLIRFAQLTHMMQYELDKTLADRKFSHKNVRDFLGFIQFCKEESMTSNYILLNLSHDLIGLHNQEPCFSPRASGYAAYWGEPESTLFKYADCVRNNLNGTRVVIWQRPVTREDFEGIGIIKQWNSVHGTGRVELEIRAEVKFLADPESGTCTRRIFVAGD